MKVLWLTFIPSPYRLAFFEELGKQCELTVLFERASSKTRKNNWDDFSFQGYEATILPGITIGGYDRLCLGVCKYLNRSYDRIVISNPTSPTGILAAAILRMKGIPYIVESDGAFPTGRKGGIRMMLKRFVMKPAQICFSTAQLHDRYYEECGVKPENLRRYPFTSLKQADILKRPVSEEEKTALRKKLGMKEKKILVSVGLFIPRKGYDVLFGAMERLDKNIACYIIGGQPTEEYINQVKNKGLKNVHFVGFKKKSELSEYYMAADLFVLPTREDIWGLVINEAMANGLPVITTDRCIAGLELVTDGENGYIVPVGDEKTLADRVQKALQTQEATEKMSYNSMRKIQGYTFEEMVVAHMRVFCE